MKVNLILLFGAFLLGCGSKNSGQAKENSTQPPPTPPSAFDLTGDWEITDVDCNTISNIDVGIIPFDELVSVVEQGGLYSRTRIAQDGNNLTFTSLPSETQYTGTIEEKKVTYHYEKPLDYAGINENIRVDVEGKVIDEDNLLQNAVLSFKYQATGYTINTNFVCAFNSERIN